MVKQLFVVGGLLLVAAGIMVSTIADAVPTEQLSLVMLRLVTATAVPETGTMLLLGALLFGTGALARRVFWAKKYAPGRERARHGSG
jgi:hypothetical protein